MKWFLSLITLMCATGADAQQMLSLDSCRAMALRNNKQLNIARLKQDVAKNIRKAARTKYLPHVDAIGGYAHTSRELSILNGTQKYTLGNIGSIIGILDEQTTAMVNQIGQKVSDAFRTDTRNIYTASVMVRQPIYMGGSITAANRIADIAEEMAANQAEGSMQSTLYNIDKAYWTVVSLRQKEKLASSFLKLVKKLDDDVAKMIKAGVATRADGLKVSVKVNEAEMQLTQVEDGLALSRMLLCQLCGMPSDSDITLEDEGKEELVTETAEVITDIKAAAQNRPEIRMLQNAIDISKQTTKLMRAANLPQIALTGGYLVTNPNLYNGFERKFSGMWNIGVLVRVPVWNWFEGAYRVRASKTATSMAVMELDEAEEKIELQINQSMFRVKEAARKLAMAKKNIERADENLRCADLGFKEGVMQTTDVMEAQTAWLQAQSQKIDAEIDVKLSQTDLKKALGELK